MEVRNETRPPSGATITISIGCRDCGYNLRSMRAEGCCPECNCAVADSVAAWERRWREVLSPGRRALLLAGATLMVVLAIGSQCFDGDSVTLVEQVAPGLDLVAWLGLMLITSVRWDSGRRGWASVPVAARVLGTVGLILVWIDRRADAAMLPVGQRVILAWAYTHIAVLTTTMLYLHIVRIANRLGWRAISRQAIAVAILMAIGASMFMVSYAWFVYQRSWLLMGIGGRFIIGEMSTRIGVVIDSGAPVKAYVRQFARDLWNNRVGIPLLLATVAAIAVMAQLAIGAVRWSRPPRVSDGG